MSKSIVENLIIGAGPAGLTTAYMLAKNGAQVLVLEQDATYVGGISRTVEYKGFLFDIGGHRFFSKAKEVVDLWDEILPDDFIERPRLSRIYYGGKFYAYPLRAFEALRNLGILESTACMASYGMAKLNPLRNPRTFHDWTRNQFGERLFSIFFKTYTEKVWGMSCDEISADWAAQRIKGLDLMAAVLDGVKRSLGLHNRGKGGAVAKTLIESFRYPRRGPGMMWEACAEKIRALGGRITLGRTVEALAWASLLSAGLALLLLLVVRRGPGDIGGAWSSPKWLWLGAVLGTFIVFTITVVSPRIGTTATIALLVAGQLAAGTVIDRFGLFGFERIALSGPRVLGIALLAAGAALTLKR